MNSSNILIKHLGLRNYWLFEQDGSGCVFFTVVKWRASMAGICKQCIRFIVRSFLQGIPKIQFVTHVSAAESRVGLYLRGLAFFCSSGFTRNTNEVVGCFFNSKLRYEYAPLCHRTGYGSSRVRIHSSKIWQTRVGFQSVHNQNSAHVYTNPHWIVKCL